MTSKDPFGALSLSKPLQAVTTIIEPRLEQERDTTNQEIATSNKDEIAIIPQTFINRITTKGIIVSALFVLISVAVKYAELYMYLLPITTPNNVTRYIGGSDALFLCLGPALIMFISYFLQKQSLFTDVPRKHLILIVIGQIVNIIQTVFHFWSLWSLGIVIKSIINLLSIVFLTVAEKTVFHKKLFIVDYFGIFLLILSVLWLIPQTCVDDKGESSTDFSIEYITGIIFEIINCLCGTFTTLLTEYICKIDYVPEMNRYFGSKKDAQKHMISGHEMSMSSAFWLGINGIIALPLCIVMIVSSSFIPHPKREDEFLVNASEFGSKLLGNKWLIVLLIGGTMLLYFKIYAATEVQIYVSSVAKKLLKSFVTIPAWIINLFIATNPRKGGEYLDSFDYSRWSEWCLIISFLFSIIGVLVYYEVMVPNKWKRSTNKDVMNRKPVDEEVAV